MVDESPDAFGNRIGANISQFIAMFQAIVASANVEAVAVIRVRVPGVCAEPGYLVAGGPEFSKWMHEALKHHPDLKTFKHEEIHLNKSKPGND